MREMRCWRGLTLRQAAGLPVLSFAFWGQVERGDKLVTKHSTLEAMARSLRVHPADLTAQPWTPADPVGADVQAGLDAIETALECYQLGADPEIPMRPWPQVAEDLQRLVTMVWTADYAAQCELAPVVLGELYGAYLRLPHHRPEVLVGLIRAYTSAAITTTALGAHGLPGAAARAAQHARRPWTTRSGWATQPSCAGSPPDSSTGPRTTAARSRRRRT